VFNKEAVRTCSQSQTPL